MLRIIGPRDKDVPADANIIYTVSTSKNWSKGLSPFFLGPVKLYGDYVSQTVENAWQYTKVYYSQIDIEGEPTEEYWKWAKEGWANPKAVRYPMGKGAKPMYALWNGEKLDYIQARKRIYVPLYSHAVVKTEAFKKLQEICYNTEETIYLWDYDGYDHKKFDMSYLDVLNCKTRKMGHAFILGWMLEIGKGMGG